MGEDVSEYFENRFGVKGVDPLGLIRPTACYSPRYLVGLVIHEDVNGFIVDFAVNLTAVHP